MENLPLYVPIVFVLTTLFTLWFLYKASGSKTLAAILFFWLLLQGFIGASGFYLVSRTLPPRFLLLVGPAFLSVLLLFLLPKGRKFINALILKWLTWLHIVRVPVELTLFWLFLNGLVPKHITFEGTNFDVFSGLSAAVIAYVVFTKQKGGRALLLTWNFICLILLINVVTTAILAAPFAFQKIAFDQPNVGVLYFPYVWLPGFIVPVVLLSHLVSIRRLLLAKTENLGKV